METAEVLKVGGPVILVAAIAAAVLAILNRRDGCRGLLNRVSR